VVKKENVKSLKGSLRKTLNACFQNGKVILQKIIIGSKKSL
jgi:hypothetical protein